MAKCTVLSKLVENRVVLKMNKYEAKYLLYYIEMHGGQGAGGPVTDAVREALNKL